MWPDRRLIDLFKTEFPIVLAPMAGVMDAELVIAAAQGGALGSLPCAMLSAEKAREQIQVIRQRVSAPVNMNFFCHTPVPADPSREAAWKEHLAPYYKELGLDPAAPVNAANRAPFDAAMCEVVEELKPEIVSFHFGLPEKDLLARVRNAGCKVISSATTVKEAIWLEENGVGCDHRARRGSGRSSRHVPDRQYCRAAGHLRAGAAGRRCRARAGDCGGWNCRRARDRGGLCAGRRRGADRDGVSALSGIQGFRAGPCRAGARAGQFHRDHQCHDRASGAGAR